MNDLPSIEGTPTPFLPKDYVTRTLGNNTSFDAGRGCPFQCSFCTIINVQGRKSRRRSPDDVERLIRENLAQGITRYFITDDNFARNKDWELILDRIIALREKDKLELGLLIQVDTLCHRIPNFIEKCKRAGVTRVFIGLENINPDNLMAAKKRQNKITEYRQDAARLEGAGHHHLCRLHPRLPRRHAESIDPRDIKIIQRELPLDILEFFFLTPLPGSEDHQGAVAEGRRDGPRPQQIRSRARRHRPSAHEPGGVGEDLHGRLVALLHARAHRDAATARDRDQNSVDELHQGAGAVHHHDAGRKGASAAERPVPAQAHRGTPARIAAESVLAFYPRFLWSLVANNLKLVSTIWWMLKLKRRIERDPDRLRYMDQALTPVRDDDEETLDLLTKTEGGAGRRSASEEDRRAFTHAAAG